MKKSSKIILLLTILATVAIGIISIYPYLNRSEEGQPCSEEGCFFGRTGVHMTMKGTLLYNPPKSCLNPSSDSLTIKPDSDEIQKIREKMNFIGETETPIRIIYDYCVTPCVNDLKGFVASLKKDDKIEVYGEIQDISTGCGNCISICDSKDYYIKKL